MSAAAASDDSGRAPRLTRFLAPPGEPFHLKDRDPGYTEGAHSKAEVREQRSRDSERLSELQKRLYAGDRWAFLLVLQGMDAAGKDSTIKHVMSGVNPQGCEVSSFKVPSDEELDHDFLWRTSMRLPRRGHIGIFNRSYYEEVIVVRVHPELLEREKLPPSLTNGHIWRQRFEDINNHEHYLVRNGIVIRKVFLHISKEEQRRRFLSRLEKPEKQWKFSMHDVEERKLWDDYMRAYEQAIGATSTPHAPWYVVPADHKWFARLVVSRIVIEALESLDLQFPKLDPAQQRELEAVKLALEKEG